MRRLGGLLAATASGVAAGIGGAFAPGLFSAGAATTATTITRTITTTTTVTAPSAHANATVVQPSGSADQEGAESESD
jgi:hypothetical protein